MRGASLVAIAVFLVVLRLMTLHVAGGELVGGALGQLEITQLPRFIQPLILSLCFELCAVLVLVVLVRRPPTRLLAKLLLGLLLLLDLAGTQVFVILRTYAKVFQLTGISVPELLAVPKAQVGLWQWLGLGICTTLAWTFGRPGSIEPAPVSRRTGTLFLLLGVAAAAGVPRLVLHFAPPPAA